MGRGGMMNEKPILMSGPMVRAILEGRKTVSRRVVKLPMPKLEFVHTVSGNSDGKIHATPWTAKAIQKIITCPYGNPGDSLLWVRETWTALFNNDDGMTLWWHNTPKEQRTQDRLASEVTYRADYKPEPYDEWPFVPSIFMPRWASRLALKVTGVRVERLQDISEADAEVEGVIQHTTYRPGYGFRDGFRTLWDEINGKRPGCSWTSDPWVWVLEFERGE